VRTPNRIELRLRTNNTLNAIVSLRVECTIKD